LLKELLEIREVLVLMVIRASVAWQDGLVQMDCKVPEDRMGFRVSQEQPDSRALQVLQATQASLALLVIPDQPACQDNKAYGDLMVNWVIVEHLGILVHLELLVSLAQLVNVDSKVLLDSQGPSDNL